MFFQEQLIKEADKLEERKYQLQKKKFEKGLNLEEKEELEDLEKEKAEMNALINDFVNSSNG